MIDKLSWPLASLVLCALLASTAPSANSLEIKNCKLDFLQLPKRVRPSHYKLDIKVDPEDPEFSGQVEIALEHNPNTNDVLCNNLKDWLLAPACNRGKLFLSADKSLEITDASYYDEETGLAIPVKSVCRSADREMIIVELSRKPGKSSSGKLKLSFTGEVRADFKGLFRADYRDTRTNTKKLIAVTQFESGHARKMFPCFDEPDFKATFELSVEHPAHLTAIANMRPVKQEQRRHEDKQDDTIKTYFGVTPKMSSYLLGFSVGEFDRIETILPGANMTIGIYTPPGRSEAARSSLGIATKAYVTLRDFFDLGQPVDKIDYVSCKEFPGAMENWGMITIEEYSVLPDVENSEATNMHYSIVTVIHEMAHQWFGNLVTLKWWDDLWLNEGFASWISNELAQQLYPENEPDFMYLLRDMRGALAMDAQHDRTHPIKNSQIQTMKEIEDSFDQITYDKANAVIRMLNDYIGQEKFKEGLRLYIRENQFGNTDDSDLWRALSETSGLDVRQLMHSWIMQAGFPLVSVKLSDAQRLEVSQERFPSTTEAGKSEFSKWKKQLWFVPITMVVSDGADKTQKIKFVLSKEKDEIKLPSWFDINKPGHWLKLNSDFQGFYRVQYETDALQQALRRAIETKSMGPTDRLDVLDEQFLLLKAGLIKQKQLKETLTWYKNEDHGAVIYLISKAMEHVKLNRYPDKFGLYSILINYYETTGRLSSDETKDVSLVKKLARAEVLKRLITGDYEPAIRDALELFEQKNGNVPVSVRDEVFAAVGKAGTDEQFKQVIKVLRTIGSKRVKKSSVRRLDHALTYKYLRRRELSENFFSLLYND